MTKLCQLLNVKSEDEIFKMITSSFRDTITLWNYFVNWSKVTENVGKIEKELNLLNYLIGKENLEESAHDLIKEYPQVVRTFPILLAVRDKSLKILIDIDDFIYNKIDFFKKSFGDEDIKTYTNFLVQSGFGELIKKKKIKNIVDYVTGVEVGLDSNGRKNRTGQLMETIVENYIKKFQSKLGFQYLAQANASKIMKEWGIEIKVDKSSRIIDFVIKSNNKLFFIEVNFYGGGGSKLKSTATEYINMNRYWNEQGINFIWITDGAGWTSTLKPLREYFDQSDYLLNLEMLKNGVLEGILK